MDFNLKGTQNKSFKIGTSGAKIWSGTAGTGEITSPSIGDIYLLSGGGSGNAYIFDGSVWKIFSATNGSNDINNISPAPGRIIIGSSDGSTWMGADQTDPSNVGTVQTVLKLSQLDSPSFQGLTLLDGTLNLGTISIGPVHGVDGSGNDIVIDDQLQIGNSNSTIIIPGNLLVQGTSTVISSGTLEVTDAQITVNKGGSSSTATQSGLAIEGDGGTIVGYFRSGSATNLLEMKAPTGNTLTLDISTDTKLKITSPTSGQVLKYVGTAFINANEGLEDLYDVSLDTTVVSGDALVYNGSNWTNMHLGTGTLTQIVAGTDLTGGTITSTGTINLVTQGTFAGTYGGTSTIPVVTVNNKGIITQISTSTVAIPSGTINLTGDVSGTGQTGTALTTTLANSGVTAGTYTLATLVVDSKGRITSASSNVISTSSVKKVITQTAHGFVIGDVLMFNGTAYTKAQADAAANAEVLGIVTSVVDANNFELTTEGYISGLSGLTAGSTYFLSAVTAGALTTTGPSSIGQVSKPLLTADTTTSGYFKNMRGQLIGTMDVYGIGTSGHSIPLLDGTNTWSNLQTFSSINVGTINGQTAFGSGSVTQIIAGSGLTGGTITGTGTIALDTTGVTSGTYNSVVVDTFGRVTSGTSVSTSVPYLEGSGTATVSNNGLALGNGAASSSLYGLAIGQGATDGGTNNGSYAIAIGLNTKVDATQGVAIGFGAQAYVDRSVAIGGVPHAIGTHTIAIGFNAAGTGDEIIVIGANNTVTGSGAIVLGSGITSSTANDIIIGRFKLPSGVGTSGQVIATDGSGNLSFVNVSASLPYLVATGTATTGGSTTDIALGNGANASNGAIVIGSGASSSPGNGAVVVGNGANASNGAIAIGSGALGRTGGVVIGGGAKNNSSSDGCIAIGSGAITGTGAASAIAIGVNAVANGSGAIVIGSAGTTTTANEIIIGNGTNRLHVDGSGNFDLSGLTLQNTVIKNIRENVTTVSSSSTAYTIDYTSGPNFYITLTGNCSLSISNAPSGCGSFTLFLQQDGTGSRTVTWPSGAKWAGGIVPTLSTSPGKIDVISFTTFDSGTSWLGFNGGIGF